MLTLRHVPILEELSKYPWKKVKKTEQKFLACSPFRIDHSPSFAVHLSHGGWVDLGNPNPHQQKGNFIALLSFLRHETKAQTEAYLIEQYGFADQGLQTLTYRLKQMESVSVQKPSYIQAPCTYFTNRGISEQVQIQFQTGYDYTRSAIVIPWFDARQCLINVKYRSIHTKSFWYLKKGKPISQALFGSDQIGLSPVVGVVESELDALTLITHGIPAVALGGGTLSKAQIMHLRRLPTPHLLLAFDHDAVGEKLTQETYRATAGYKTCQIFDFPTIYKDVNEVPETILRMCIEKHQKRSDPP